LNAQAEHTSGKEEPGPPVKTHAVVPGSLSRLLFWINQVKLALRPWLQANSFSPRWLPRPLRHPASRYFAALLIEALAVYGSVLLINWCPEFAFKALLPVLAVILVALSWGGWPGLLATVWGALLLDRFVLPPPLAWDNGGGNDTISLLLFLLVGSIISMIAGQSRWARRQAEEMTYSLKEEQARTERERLRLRTLLDALPAPVGMVDAQGRFLERTPACKTLWGEGAPVPCEIADYQHVKAWWPDTGQPLAVEDWGMFQALTNGEMVTNREIEVETFDGQHKIVLDSATPIRDKTGTILGAVGMLKDVTDLKRLEQARRRAEREAAARASQLQAVFEAMSEAVLVFDSQTRIVQRNAADRQLFPFETEPETLAERRALVRLRDEQGQPIPNDQLSTLRALQGELVTNPHGPDVMVTTKEADRLLNVTAAPMRDAEGRICGGVMVMRDVTERRRLEEHTRHTLNALLGMAEALVQTQEGNEQAPLPEIEAAQPMVARRLAELTHSVLGSHYVGIAAVKPETDTLVPIAIAGISPEQEQQWWTSWDKSAYLGQHLPPALVAALRAGEPITLDSTQLPAAFWHHVAPGRQSLLVPMRVGETLVGLLRVDCGAEQQDLTCPNRQALIRAVARLGALVLERERLLQERAEAQASALALREANAQMDTFLGMAGHELKTPLTSIKLALQLAERRIRHLTRRAPAVAHELAPLVEQSMLAESQVARLERLVNDLLDVSRIQAGKLELRLESADLATIVHKAAEEQRQANPARTIVVQVPADLRMSIIADADRIGQVVTNYLTNALKYSLEEHPVTLSIEAEDHLARVWVRDQGPGLPAEEQERIWERFHRVKGVEVQSGSGIGLGLGLHICRTIVEHHQGQVGVESAPGQGSTFWFTMPLTASAAAPDDWHPDHGSVARADH
jgi:PAS domain S-box-containing protein